MKRVFFIVAWALFFSLSCFGQRKIVQPWGVLPGGFDREKAFGNNPSSENFYNDMRAKFGRLGEETRLTLEDIDGTIYLNENFTLGSLYENGEAFKNLYLRYDAYNDEVELKETSDADLVRAMVKHPAYSCNINGEDYYYLSYKDEDGVSKEGYLTPLVSGGDYVLFVKRIKVFKEGKPAKTSLDKGFPHRFLDKTEYYVSRAGETPIFMKNKKSDVIAIFLENDRDAIKEYVKNKRTNVNNDGDLLNLFTYANTL
ncbi:MAG: hypothetical protein R2819_14295 [Allomuricauda sp.]